MFNRIMVNHRALPLLFPLIAILIISTLATFASSIALGLWLSAVVVIWTEIAVFSYRYFSSRLSHDAESLTRSLTIRYLNANIVWTSMLWLFWMPDSHSQDFFLLLLFVAHLSIATATTAYEWRIYLACTVPIAGAVVIACLQTGDNIYIAVGAVVAMVYVFMMGVTKQVIAQARSAVALRLEHDDLIRDLAKAKAESDSALRETEAANQRIVSRERRFRALVDNAFDGVAVIDEKAEILFATEAIARMLDTSRDAISGTSVADHVLTEHHKEIQEFLDLLLSSPDQQGSISVWAETVSGRKIWIDASARNMLHDESVNGIVLNVRDATDRMNADSELKMHLHVLESLVRGSSMTDVLNELAKAMEDQKAGMRASILLVDENDCLTIGAAPSLPPLYVDAFEGMAVDAGVGPCGLAAESGETIIVPDTATHPIFEKDRSLPEKLNIKSVWSHPISTRDGRVLGSVGMLFHRTRTPSEGELKFLAGAAQLAAIAIERRRAEQRLAEALRTAEIANHSKSQFLANMSHELRTPLNAIIGFSEMIREEMFGPVGAPEYEAYVRDIHSSGKHLLELINDILDISKIEAGQFDIVENWADLKILANWSAELVRPRAYESNVTLVIDIADNIPEAYVDERAMKQVLLNLLSNAVKFTPAGGDVTLSARLDSEANLALSVADTGIGIEPHMISKVMEPFGQAEGPMARSFGGTGLGLPITKSLVELHGGSLTLESTHGVGTTVTVVLPAWRARQEGPDHPSDDQAQAVSQ